MIKNPFCKCLHPKKIVNPYTNESMVVPCGHCQACTLAKNSRYAFQCDLESYTAKHTLFITLTYANRDRKSTRLNSSHTQKSRMPSSA